MSEAALWQLAKKGIFGHLIRIENTSGSGTPDVHACFKGHETWIELKTAKGKWLHFRSSQISWFHKRVVGHGGACAVLWRDKDELCIADARNICCKLHYAIPAKDRKSCKIPIEKIEHEKFKKPWNWQKISEKLYGHIYKN
tara:strand:+ start:30284 stop:30706 length:423 start_codon:yes stop_codon:yes gene_type:complete